MSKNRNNAALAELDDKTLLLVTGKGGVGKTSITSNLCLRYLKRHQRVLRIDIELPQFKEKSQHINDLFLNNQGSGRFSRMNLTSRACFEQYLENKKFLAWLSAEIPGYLLKSSYLTKRFFDSRVVDLFLSSAPGFREIVIMGKIYFEAKTGNWDKVIVDLPATGHALDLISAPFVSGNIFSSGFAGQESKKVVSYLTSPQSTAVVTVTISEEMAISETVETLKKLDEFGLNSPIVFFNRCPRKVVLADRLKDLLEQHNVGDYASIINEVAACELHRFNHFSHDYKAFLERVKAVDPEISIVPTPEIALKPGQEITFSEIVDA
jgi:anion-transporting  ArsA/GET3 family ATPase